MTMRIGSFGLSVDGMGGYGEGNLEPGPTAWVRLHGQLAAEQPDTLLDHYRALVRLLLVHRRQTPGKREPSAVVVDRQTAHALADGQAYDDVAGAAVFPHVDERLLDDPRDFPARARREIDPIERGDESRRDPGLPLEPLDDVGDGVHQLIGRHVDWLHPLDQV